MIGGIREFPARTDQSQRIFSRAIASRTTSERFDRWCRHDPWRFHGLHIRQPARVDFGRFRLKFMTLGNLPDPDSTNKNGS